ncbi:hypothetical protein K470DRAFT_257619 [Piedraia hortae CBS 480.64]|uniref:Pathogen-related protein n=1 Tax=Piedraia hortae CBS 480.64 TaxID=1314780 RepID=A0A6A7C0K8_9PEZI|nr:hypothetical protein K470DRAFT_257619 [Piedraia hortae CBS 480.64]
MPSAEAAPADFLTSPNAVFGDEGVQWRYGRAPDYSKTRKYWEETKKMNHKAGSLEEIVENLVKNWEVEASFKPRLSDWRTIDHAKYSFAINGGPPQTGEHMLKVGTYNAIITPNEYYSPEHSDFASSHKTFKRMMPTFAWEVIEVYSGPPKVSFKWRHWGQMKNDYVGFNNVGEKIIAKAHGGPIEIFGVTVAQVDENCRIQALDTWFDPLEMFRQIAPQGIINKEAINKNVSREEALESTAEPSNDGIKIAQQFNNESVNGANGENAGTQPEKHISNETGKPADAFVPSTDGEIRKPESNYNAANEFASQGLSTEAVLASAPDARPLDVQVPPGAVDSSSVSGNAEDRSHSELSHKGELCHSEVGHQPTLVQEASGDAQTAVKDKFVEEDVKPNPGEAVAVKPTAEETRLAHEEMSRIFKGECPFLMNGE